MKPAIVIADMHLWNFPVGGGKTVAGVNRRARLTLDALACVGDLAEQHGCPVYLLGDVFDAARPAPQLVTAFMDATKTWRAGSIVLVGNHDRSSAALHDHAVQISRWNRHAVIETSGALGRVIGFGYRSDPIQDWLPVELPLLVGDALLEGVQPTTLLLHAGLYEAGQHVPDWKLSARDAISVQQCAEIAAQNKIPLVLSGHWHDSNAWTIQVGGFEVRIVQVGGLVPTGWDNAGPDFGFAYLIDTDTGSVLHRYRIPGPRFYVCTGVDEIAELRQSCATDAVFIRFRGAANTVAPAADLLGALEQAGEIAGWTVEAITQDRDRLEADVEQARGEDSILQACEMVARERFGAHADAVLRRCREYLSC
jgi:hypothetical protein